MTTARSDSRVDARTAGAALAGADFARADFARAVFGWAAFGSALFGWTVFVDAGFVAEPLALAAAGFTAALAGRFGWLAVFSFVCGTQ